MPIHFIVAVVSRSIIDDDVASVDISPYIPFPQITMYQARLDLPALRLQSTQQSWNHMCVSSVQRIVELYPMAVGIPIELLNSFE